jgi:hypothetical protein
LIFPGYNKVALDFSEKEKAMLEGIQFVINERGEKTAVQIDLKKHSELWEDIYDALIAKSRLNEPRETLEEVKQRLIEQGKLDG